SCPTHLLHCRADRCESPLAGLAPIVDSAGQGRSSQHRHMEGADAFFRGTARPRRSLPPTPCAIPLNGIMSRLTGCLEVVQVSQDEPAAPVSARDFLTAGVGWVHPEERVLEAMLAGWRQQMLSRNLSPGTVQPRLRQVRALVEHANEYPWAWSLATVDEW